MWPSSSIMSSSTVTNNSVCGGGGSSSSIKQDCCPEGGDTGPTMLGMDHCLPCWEKIQEACINWCRSCEDYIEQGPTLCRRCTTAFSKQPSWKTLEELREMIKEIETKIEYTRGLTASQRAVWARILRRRRYELAENEKDMWAGYDQDDLNKMDLANRRGW